MKDSMYNVTSTVKNMFDNNYVQQIRIHMDTVGGGSYDITENDILAGSFSIDRYSVTGNRIEIGTATAGECSFRMKNYDSRWDNVSFEGAQMYVTIRIADWSSNPSDADITVIPCGYFTVDKPVKNAQILEITALDRMARFDRHVDTSALAVTYTTRNLIDFCCTQCGVLLANGSELANYPNANYTVSIPENVGELTYRNLLQGACMLLGACAFIDWNGQLQIKWYEILTVKSVTGNPIVITDGAENRPVKDCTVDIQPSQPNDYDSVWVGGAGKNLLPSPTNQVKTSNGITISVNNGVYSISGTATATAEIIFDLPSTVSYTADHKTAFLNNAINAGVVVYWRNGNTNGASMGFGGSTNRVAQYTSSSSFDKVRFLISSGTVISGTLVTSPVLCLKSVPTPTSFIPYENICPISGWTEAEIQRTGNTNTTYTVNWESEAGTVYGGTLDVTTGVLTVTMAHIASYSDEVLPSSWISDRDVYAEGATPSTGAEVVYTLAIPQTYQLTPTEITTLLGNNAITCNCGNITLSYFVDTDRRNLVDLGDEFWETDITESSGDEINVAYSPLSRSVTVNGTSSMEGRCNLVDITLNAGTYLLSGIPYGLQSLQFQVTGAEVNAFDSGGGALFTVPSSGTYRVYLFVPEGNYTYDNVEVAPSIIKMPDVYPYYTTSNRYNHTLQENDIEITGVYYAYEDEERVLHEYLNGTKDYCLDISDNPFVNRQTVESVVQALGTARVGFTYRPITMTVKPAPYLYPMDMFDFLTVKGEIVHGIVSKITFGVNAHTHIESNGETKEDNGYATYGNFTSIQSKIIEKAKTQISRVVNERTTMLLNLNEMIANSLGLYVTAEPVTGGGYQYYFHDGTTLSSSNIIYTFTADGLAWTDSWNGGSPVWQYGITRDGNAIVNMLNAYKISADIISGGVIMADTGNNYWNLRTGDFYNSIVTKGTHNVQNYIINPLLTIGSGETAPYYWGVIGSDTAEVVNDTDMGMCWHFISTTAKCGARNNAAAIQVNRSVPKVYVGANVKVVQSGYYSNLGYKVSAQLSVTYSDNTTATLHSVAYVSRLNTAEQVTFEFEVNSSKTINYLNAGFYNTYISTQDTTQETYYADTWCALVDVSDSDSFTINATASGYTTSTIDYVGDTEVGHVLMNEEKAEFVGTTVKGSEIVFAPTATSAVTAKESLVGSNGGVIFEGNGDFTVETATVGITGTGSSGGIHEVQIVGYDGNGNYKNLIQMDDDEMAIEFNGNTHHIIIKLSDSKGLRIEIDGTGYSNLGWVNDGNGHVVLGK